MTTGMLQRFPQPADVDVNRSLLQIRVCAPHVVQELRPAERPLRMRHEELEQSILGRTEVDFVAVAGNPVGNRIQVQVTRRNPAFIVSRAGPSS